MIFHENRLPADDSHEISYLICYCGKGSKILNCRMLQIIGGALWAKSSLDISPSESGPPQVWTLCLPCQHEESLYP